VVSDAIDNMDMMSAVNKVDNGYRGQVVILDAALSICTDVKPDLAFFRMQINRLHFSSRLWIDQPKHMAAKFLAEQYEKNGLPVWDLYDAWLANFTID